MFMLTLIQNLGASIEFSDSVIVPESSVTTGKVADCYGLTLYKESQSELTPLEFITSPTFINKKETLSVSESIQISKSYSASKSVENSFNKKASGGIELKGIARIGGEISTTSSVNLSYGYQYIVSNIRLNTETIVIDGVENKFGVMLLLIVPLMLRNIMLTIITNDILIMISRQGIKHYSFTKTPIHVSVCRIKTVITQTICIISKLLQNIIISAINGIYEFKE